MHKFNDMVVIPMDTNRVFVRISDSVFEEKDWPIDYLLFEDSVVTRQENVNEGKVYELPDMIGWTKSQVSGWSMMDSTGSRVETFHEIKVD